MFEIGMVKDFFPVLSKYESAIHNVLCVVSLDAFALEF